jgi:uncharacterized protein (TIGR02217 family)
VVLKDFVDPDYGRQFPVEMEFIWKTDVVSYGLQEQSNQVWSRPKRRWFINWAALKTAARDKLIELHGRAAGRARTFYFKDEKDYSVAFTDWSYTATGGETTVQLGKDYYPGQAETWSENKKAIVPGAEYSPTVKVDAATLTEGVEYALDDDTGIVDFTSGSAPRGALGAGEVVTADFQFYFVVKFESDRFRDSWITPELMRPKFNLLEVVT